MKKRILSLCIVMTMVLLLLPETAKATEIASNTCGDNVIWSLDDSGTMRITGTGEMWNYTSAYTNPIYKNRLLIKKIVIDDGVTRIGRYTFTACAHYTSITIPASVTSIGMSAFLSSSKLSDVYYSGTVAQWQAITIEDHNELLISANIHYNSTGSDATTVSRSEEVASGKCGTNVTWTLDDAGMVTISGSGAMTDLSVGPFCAPSIGRKIKTATIENGVTSIGTCSFMGCDNLTRIVISDGVTSVGEGAFSTCDKLASVTFPISIAAIGDRAFNFCSRLTDVYYSGTRTQWETIAIGKWNESLDNATIHYSNGVQTPASSSANTNESNSSIEYLYDAYDSSATMELPTDALDKITDSSSAVSTVNQLTSSMTSEQKSSPTGVDLATLYAETAVFMAARETADEGAITVSAATVADLASVATQTAEAVERALSSGGVTTVRYLTKTVAFTTDETDISIRVDPDILTAQVDRIRVETPAYALTLNLADLKEVLTEPLTFLAQEVLSSYALGKTGGKTAVKIDLPKGQMSNPIIVSLPQNAGSTTYQAVVKTDGTAASSKFNPATLTMDGRINSSGTYTVRSNEKSFSDISNKSAEMQKAILYLTSKGIINGTSATTFSPDGSINRQQIAALLMRALGKVDNTATTTFTDVSRSSGLYTAIASSQQHGVINGYPDNTFRGTNVISRAQIVTVSGRVLTSEMNYKAPADTSIYLARYSDTVPDYAQDMVALATREGLIVYRTDGTFSGAKNMSRGDAAIILYRLFQKIW